ncbi:MAG: hypothetical protein WKF84_21490 [Pyrinomonadaceae bacterium]
MALPFGMVTPDFDGQNIVDAAGFADLLAALTVEAGLARRHRWSAALPTLSARTAVLVLESGPTSRAELSEMLSWKIERGFGAPAAELRVSRERLANDERGRTRFLATAIRLSVLSEYEAIFENLGWNVGLILPRPLGEVRWLMNGTRSDGDGLMVSSHAQGFTAMIVRGDQPILIRSAVCVTQPSVQTNCIAYCFFTATAPQRSPMINQSLIACWWSAKASQKRMCDTP